MGVVYEAEQVSLRRRVALKVLPFAALMDPRQLARFKNEAHSAACLQHQSIVPVYSVGCERGVHYYSKQYVEGQSLAQVIAEAARLRGQIPAGNLKNQTALALAREQVQRAAALANASKPPQLEEFVRCCSAAAALRPDKPRRPP